MSVDPNIVLFYVESPTISTKFYSEILGMEPVQSSPTFSLFELKPGFRLGLWSVHEVAPGTSIRGGGGEFGLEVATESRVDELFNQWQQGQISIIQKPEMMDFGYNFMALDPDHHRIRVFSRRKPI